MKQMMIDIETLGTGPAACVISVGVVAFSQTGVIDSQGWAIRPADWHGDIDGGTVQWWMKQNEAARTYSFNGEEKDISVALALGEFIRAHDIKECWANDPDFDIVIMKSWWSRVASRNHLNTGPFPIKYNGSRSFRTIKGEADRLGIAYGHVYNPATVAHHPVDDAANQARVVNFIRNQIVRAEK